MNVFCWLLDHSERVACKIDTYVSGIRPDLDRYGGEAVVADDLFSWRAAPEKDVIENSYIAYISNRGH